MFSSKLNPADLLRWSLVALAFSLPFELERPLARVGPLQVTNVEALLGLVLLLGLVARWRQPATARQPLLPASWAWLGGLFVLALLASSLAAAPQGLGGNALKASLRLLSGLVLFLAVRQGAAEVGARRSVLLALVSGGLLAALVGVAEFWHGDGLPALTPFRANPTVVGPFIRLTGPFAYANQAAMFLEALIPLLLGFAWEAWGRGQPGRSAVWAALLLLCFQAVVLTFSRASLASLILVCLALIWWLAGPAGKRRLAAPWAALAGVAIALIAVNALLNPVIRLRFQGEDDNAWYGATITVPASLTLVAGSVRTVPVHLANNSIFTWRSSGSVPIQLGARWTTLPVRQDLASQPRWPFANPIQPGQSASLQVPLRAPAASGQYELVWDIVQENVTWFEAKQGAHTSTLVTVVQESVAPASEDDGPALLEASGQTAPTVVFAAPTPPRSTLWPLAWHMAWQHPWLGIGLDNFRLSFGPALGLSRWNQTVHSNNWYLEMLVSLGLGSLPFLAWLGLLLVQMGRRLRRQPTVWQMALSASLLLFLVHGFLDYFLLFNATGLLFWLLVALWLAEGSWGGRRDA